MINVHSNVHYTILFRSNVRERYVIQSHYMYQRYFLLVFTGDNVLYDFWPYIEDSHQPRHPPSLIRVRRPHEESLGP